MEIRKFEFNPFPVNTYLLWDEESKEAVIIDAGCYFPEEREELKNFIQLHRLQIKHLIATHLHLDHNFGNPFVSHTFQVPLEAHSGDEFLLLSMKEQAQMFGMPLPDPPIPIGNKLNEGDTVVFGQQRLDAIHVPGHSPGSLVFYHPEAGIAFVGDVLFKSSIGRTDLPGGNYQQLISGIQNKLLTLPDTTIVYPGHGTATTIGDEKMNNPYL